MVHDTRPHQCLQKHRISLTSLTLVLATAFTLLPAESTPRPDLRPVTFERHEISTGGAKHQTILTGSILGGPPADVIVVSVHEGGEGNIQVFSAGSNQSWSLKLETDLGRDVWFVDVATIGGRDRLITYREGRLRWFDPLSKTERDLVSIASQLQAPPPGPIPHLDITRDLNGDGLDDLAVPDSEGFWVLTQTPDGGFAPPLRVGSRLDTRRLYQDEGYRHNAWSHSRIYAMDYNRDGRRDLVSWNQDRFEVHLQDANGSFSPEPEAFTTEVAFDSDDLASLAAPYGVRRRRMDNNPTGHLTGRVLHSLRDMNGDGIGDLVIFALRGGSLWRMQSSLEIHFGSPVAGGTGFASKPDATLSVDGIPFDVRLQDLDADGQVDVMYTVIDPGVFKAFGMIIGALLTRSVSMDLKFYRMDKGTYSNRPHVSRKLKAYPGGSGEPTAYSPALTGDVNGDGPMDLVLGRRKSGLRIFFGEPGPIIFTRQAQKVALPVPKVGEYCWLADLNRDGRQDIVLHLPTDPVQKVHLLIAH